MIGDADFVEVNINLSEKVKLKPRITIRVILHHNKMFFCRLSSRHLQLTFPGVFPSKLVICLPCAFHLPSIKFHDYLHFHWWWQAHSGERVLKSCRLGSDWTSN